MTTTIQGPSARVIADSIVGRHRLTTMEVRMHRFVLAEFNTHRVFSRNSASSRAIPIEKRIDEAKSNPALPLSWGSNKPGMQAGEELDSETRLTCIGYWLHARDAAVMAAESLSRKGLHKQVANRLLEPFLWHTVIVSSTEWDNFFVQRCSPLAQPEIRAAAEMMRVALDLSKPVWFNSEGNNWHMPYVMPLERETLSLEICKKLSVARCARVSYLTHDGQRDNSKDLELYFKLRHADPPHWSPFEHVARPLRPSEVKERGNFEGWMQLRHEVGC